MTSDELLIKYQGQLVPQSYNVGFVVLSYVVSLIGAGSTLELIYRRTGSRGLFNQYVALHPASLGANSSTCVFAYNYRSLLLAGAAVAMGGVAIWSMHFVGNRAIELAGGEPELQPAYASGSSAISFFVPIAVLLAAFVAFGTNDKVSWLRISIGGFLCGVAVCGMHYLGNASIANYTCIYHVPNVVGAAITAVIANTAALSMFFVFRSTWTSSWWKRMLSALVMAGAVCGMHWCAAVGTEYRLVTLKPLNSGLSRNTTVIIVLCLAITSCFVIASTAVISARNRSKATRKAQQITLGAAVFDKNNRILVDSYGRIPSAVVIDSFPQVDKQDEFDDNHPLFHWMFQASRSWQGISNVLHGINRRQEQLPHAVELVNAQGELVDGYNTLCREMFCVAAMNLAEQLKGDVSSAGVLWDEILPTGAGSERNVERQQASVSRFDRILGRKAAAASDEEGIMDRSSMQRSSRRGRGALMFLVGRVQTDREAERLAWAGFRFAEVQQVSNIIESTMHVLSPCLDSKLRQMAHYANQENKLSPGLHLGFFGVRARVGTPGFDVIVRKGAKGLLPSCLLQKEKLDPDLKDLLARLRGMTPPAILQQLAIHTTSADASERVFATYLSDAIELLKSIVQEPTVFETAVLGPHIINLGSDKGEGDGNSAMLSFQALFPIHTSITGSEYEFAPLSLFKAHQLSLRHGDKFVETTQQELAHVVWEGASEDVYELKARTVSESDEKSVTRTDRRPSSFSPSQASSKSETWHIGEGTSRFFRDKRERQSSVHYPKPQRGGPGGGIVITQVVTVSTETSADEIAAAVGGDLKNHCDAGQAKSWEAWAGSTMEIGASPQKTAADAPSRGVVRARDLEGPPGLSFVNTLFINSFRA